MLKFIVFFGFSVLPLQGFAWGSIGHQVIATLASEQLTPKAQVRTQALLALEPGSTLASVSTWADEHKSRTTAPWHYVNFPRNSCNYVPERDCSDGNCLPVAIERQLAVLRSDASDVDKLKALKYLVHFVGDLHQPLHAGYADDKGGNGYQIQLFKRGSNLHAAWDSGLIKIVSDEPVVWVSLLKTKRVLGRVEMIDPVLIAQESCQIVGRPGFYPDRQVHSEYVDRYRPILEQQLNLGGARLARMLNRLWP